MFDIGWQEIFIIAILALIVVGPKDLPKVVRLVTHWIRKARGLAREFQGGINEMVREAELDDIKKQITDAKSFDLNSELEKSLDPNGEIAAGLKGSTAELDDEAEGMGTENTIAKPAIEKSVPVETATKGEAEIELLNQPQDDDDDVMPAAPAEPKTKD